MLEQERVYDCPKPITLPGESLALCIPKMFVTALLGRISSFGKRGILECISNAKRPETRAKRIEETDRLAAENKRANRRRM